MYVTIYSSVALVLFFFGALLAVLLGDYTNTLVISHFILALITAVLAVKNHRSAGHVSSKWQKHKIVKTLSITMCLAALLGLYLIARSANVRWDSTEQKVHSLSQASIEVATNIKGTLSFLVIANRTTKEGTRVLDLVNRYVAIAPGQISVRMIDPKQDPTLSKNYGLSPGDSLVVSFTPYDGEALHRALIRVNERTITAAIASFESDPIVMYVSQGHGEPSVSDTSAAGLSKLVLYAQDQGYNVQPLVLTAVGAIPSDAKVLMVPSPAKMLGERESRLIESYLTNGGDAILLHDPESSNSVPQLALGLGIGIQKAVVLDQEKLMYGADSIGWQLLLNSFGAHSITSGMGGERLAVFLIASPLKLLEEYKQDRKYYRLLSSSPSSWAERDLSILEQSQPQATYSQGRDTKGPFPLAVAVERSNGSKVLVAGDSQWVQNANIDLFSHREFILSAMDWAADSHASSVPISRVRFSYMPITESFYSLLLVLSYLIPELVVILGLLLHHRRSKRWQTAN